jgi:hypothetical protein
MVRHGLKHIFQKPTPDIDSSDRTQQIRSKTVYASTVNLAKTLSERNNSRYKTYNGPYTVSQQAVNSKLVASHSYYDLLSITKGKVLLNQLPLTPTTQAYYQKNFASGQMYEGNYNQFDPSTHVLGPTGIACENTVMVYDIGVTGFTGPTSYNDNGGFVGATGPQTQEGVSYIGFNGYLGTTVASGSEQNKFIFIDPNHCYYSDPCLQDASYTRFVTPVLSGLTGTGNFNAQQIINADQYRGFSYPMPDFNLTCKQQLSNQSKGPIFCPPVYQLNTLTTTFPSNMYGITYVTSDGLKTSSPQADGFTIYQFGTSGTVPIDTAVARIVTYNGAVPLDIHYALVGGGGGGGSSFNYNDSLLPASSSGGGGGGFFYSTFPSLPEVQLLSGVSYTVIVGGGGSAGSITGPDGQPGTNGKDCVIYFESGSKTGYGGGGGATAYKTNGGVVGTGNNGNNSQGNGGGGAGSISGSGSGGTGTFVGGPGSNSYAGAGGGGGMTQIGGAVPGKVSKGGDGVSNSISGATQYYGAGGGGGAAFNNEIEDNYGVGGLGGGGNGGWWNTKYILIQAQNGANVYGSGGGGAYSVLPPVSPLTRSSVSGGSGGSGSVWIRFKSYTLLN